MRKIASLFAGLLLAVLLFGCGQAPSTSPGQTGQPSASVSAGQEAQGSASSEATYTVTRVVDGDTIEVSIDGKTEKVRLIGVDTPETVDPNTPVQPYGKEASAFTGEQLTGKQVTLEKDISETDKYGRLLRYVWLDGQLFNEVLVRQGYAQVATYPPDVKYVDRFTAAQTEAREANRGLWGISSSASASNASSQDSQVNQTTTPVTAKPSTPPAEEKKEITVYITRTGEKYHRDGCRYLSRSRIPISLKNAKAQGYTPCKVCRPPS